MRLDNVITPTRVELGQRCYRRHVIADRLERHSYVSPSAEFGSVIHAGAAAWWRSGDLHAATDAAISEWNKRQASLNEGHSLELAAAIMAYYAGHAALAGPIDDDYRLVSVEERLEVPIGDFTLSFQSDRVLSLNNERLLIVDTKTASRLDKRWRSQWETSVQMKLYQAAAGRLYDMPVSIVVEGVLKAAAPKIEYVVCPEWDAATLLEAEREMLRIARMDEVVTRACRVEDGTIDADLLMRRVLINVPFNYGDCYSYNIECPYRRLCTAPPNERVGLLKAEYFEREGDY